MLNLQLYYAKSNTADVELGRDAERRRRRRGADGRRPCKTAGTRPTWPTDGRDGGVPDPAGAGPPMIQIGTEGGFCPRRWSSPTSRSATSTTAATSPS